MIIVSGTPLRPEEAAAYATGGIEKKIIDILLSSSTRYEYDSPDELKFELNMRREIIAAARAQNKSGLDFAVFRKSRCNPEYWQRNRDGGFQLKAGAKPSAAIRDIFQNGSKYATECATALLILYYGALLKLYPEERFDRNFRRIELMNWHRIDPLLQEVGYIRRVKDFLPGDRRYFENPDVDPLTPEWQGENVIDLGDGSYYGHGIGIADADTIIRALNENRAENADESARLLDSVGRPDFKKLFRAGGGT